MRRRFWLLPALIATAGCTGECDVLWPALAGEPPPCRPPAEADPQAAPGDEAMPADGPVIPVERVPPGVPPGEPPVEPAVEPADPREPVSEPDWPILTLGTFYDSGALIDDRVLPVPDTGTPQAERYRALAADLMRLRAVLPTYDARLAAARSQRESASVAYYGELAGVSARIQQGGALGDPALREALDRAEAHLQTLAGAEALLGQLADEVAADRSLASLLRDQLADAAALRPQDPADEETRERLSDAVEETASLFDRMLEEVDTELAAAQDTDPAKSPELAALRQAIADGVLPGLGVGRTGLPSADPQQTAIGSGFDAFFRTDGRLPLVVVRLDEHMDGVRPALWQAVAGHVSADGSDQSHFAVVAVSPDLDQDSAEALYAHQVLQRAEAVRQSLLTLGVAGDRVRLFTVSSRSVSQGEVRLYGP
ncbi:MAG: hypothetical protein H6842_14155 [Rhodospirillaceae bacterium]|nr:hypothetical protein [Rhodospirillaceae bacterium]